MHSLRPDFHAFERLAAVHPSVPLCLTLVCDDLTPVSAYAALAADAPHAFLLESVVGGETVARYSFIGCDPTRTFYVRDDQVRIETPLQPPRRLTCPDPLRPLEAELRATPRARLPGLPRFVGGAVGYAAYDLVRRYEHLPDPRHDDRALPDALFGLYETLVVFDHVQKTVLLVTYADTRSATTRQAYDDAGRRLDDLARRLDRRVPLPRASIELPADRVPSFTSNLDRPAFEHAVDSCQQLIRAGDIFQVVLSHRLRVPTRAQPFDIYRALRVINPSPFMFFLKAPEVVLIGASPEVMCRVEDGLITSRPLAGTRRRGFDEREDALLRDELLADEKERAEHVMLVDLARNDVGRVAVPGSIRVSDVMTVERYSHVMHLCSTVTGRLRPDLTAFDALRAALPVGTVSGAPKVRAMQIIDQFEPTRRGPYAGAVGYVDFAGNMDTCIALRTIAVTPGTPHPVAWVQAGAGVVADSNPAREYQETLSKARGMLAAIRVAEGWVCG